MQDFECDLAETVLLVLDDIKSGKIRAETADKFFVELWDKDIVDRKALSAEAEELLFEGNLFHDWGTEFGPDQDLIIEKANTILSRCKPQTNQ